MLVTHYPRWVPLTNIVVRINAVMIHHLYIICPRSNSCAQLSHDCPPPLTPYRKLKMCPRCRIRTCDRTFGWSLHGGHASALNTTCWPPSVSLNPKCAAHDPTLTASICRLCTCVHWPATLPTLRINPTGFYCTWAWRHSQRYMCISIFHPTHKQSHIRKMPQYQCFSRTLRTHGLLKYGCLM